MSVVAVAGAFQFSAAGFAMVLAAAAVEETAVPVVAVGHSSVAAFASATVVDSYAGDVAVDAVAATAAVAAIAVVAVVAVAGAGAVAGTMNYQTNPRTLR